MPGLRGGLVEAGRLRPLAIRAWGTGPALRRLAVEQRSRWRRRGSGGQGFGPLDRFLAPGQVPVRLCSGCWVYPACSTSSPRPAVSVVRCPLHGRSGCPLSCVVF